MSNALSAHLEECLVLKNRFFQAVLERPCGRLTCVGMDS